MSLHILLRIKLFIGVGPIIRVSNPITVDSYGFLFNCTTEHDGESGLRLNDGPDVKL